MISFFEKINSCLLFPYSIVFILFLCLIILKRKSYLWFFLAMLFMVLWRFMHGILSSRYNASFLLINIISLVFFFRVILFHKSRTGTIAAIVCIVLFLTFNAIKLNSSFRNNYVFDVKDDIRTLLSTNQVAKVCILEKEFERFHIPELSAKKQIRIDYSIPGYDLNSFYINYCLWNTQVLFVYQLKETKTNNLSKLLNYSNRNGVSFYPIRRYYTNKSKHASFLVLSSRVNIPPIPTEIRQMTKDGVLKAYNPDHDVFIFQVGNRMLWFVGKPITQRTEFFFFFSTNRPELLPPHRIQYGTDNKNFFVTDEKSPFELAMCSKYRVFERVIPTGYPITSAKVGYYYMGKPVWVSHIKVAQ